MKKLKIQLLNLNQKVNRTYQLQIFSVIKKVLKLVHLRTFSEII